MASYPPSRRYSVFPSRIGDFGEGPGGGDCDCAMRVTVRVKTSGRALIRLTDMVAFVGSVCLLLFSDFCNDTRKDTRPERLDVPVVANCAWNLAQLIEHSL